MEADGRKFYTAEGVESDLFALMKQIGMNAIRLRVFVDPEGYGYGPWCDKADVVDGVPQKFTLIGAGWGHGVGLCQIGAAVMGAQGYKYDEILLHYYRTADLKKLYK